MDYLHFCTIRADLKLTIIGPTPAGLRINAAFSGTATSPHWEGELPMDGIDYMTERSDGSFGLDIRATIGSGREVIGYQAFGVSLKIDDTTYQPRELIRFETVNPNFAYLNNEIAVGMGHAHGSDLTIQIFLVRP